MMLTPTALMKPTITAFETNLSAEPSRKIPATSIRIPVTIDSVNSARAGSLPSCTDGTSATMMAIAPVA